MCGINGFNFVDRKILKEMSNSIKHRGPDSEGEFFDRGVSLGHRRLAILDLTKNGHQPMKYTHKSKVVWIVFNGEIYNFLEIKQELEEKGYRFRTKCDTEVILASYLEYGENCVQKFNGMWSFCIYDPAKKILFLSRDRFGKKPLYYSFFRGKFIFSSEIKGVLKHNIGRKINKDSVDLFFSLGFIPSPHSIYSTINKLEPSTNLIFDLKKKTLRKNEYYQKPKYKPEYEKEKLILEIKRVTSDAVKKRMISDVPVGAFLSGGVDSSAVVKEISKSYGPKNLNTFSIGFDGKYDESKFIKIVSSKFKTVHRHKYFVESDFKKELDNFAYYFDEPFGDPSLFPTIFLSKFAREKVTVSLSGDGGDEIFGGYPRYKLASQIELLRRIPIKIRNLFLKLPISRRFKEGIMSSLLKNEEIYSESRSQVYKPESYKIFMKEKFSECLELTKNNLTEAMILMDRYYLTLGDNYLTKVDRASMAHALEIRSPFLDYRFDELASRIPTSFKVNYRKQKILMKEALKYSLPSIILNRRKMGFTPPVENWILAEIFQNEIKKANEELYGEKIISKEWKSFFEDKIIGNKDILSKNYQIRMLLFYRWYVFWIKD